MSSSKTAAPSSDSRVDGDRRVTLVRHCIGSRCVARDSFESAERAHGRFTRDPRSASSDSCMSTATCAAPPGPARAMRQDDRAGLPRTRQRVGDRDHPRSRTGHARGRHQPDPDRERRPPQPRLSLDRRRAAPPADRRVLVFSDLAPGRASTSCAAAVSTLSWSTPPDEPEPDVASIGSANWAGGLAAAQHLIELGHRRIGMISGPEDMLCSIARVDGYRSALDRAGIGFEPELLRAGDFHVEGGRRAAGQLLDAHQAANGDLRRQRPPGARRLRRRAPARDPGSRGSLGRRLRRPAHRALGRPAAHDDPPAARLRWPRPRRGC